jgi:endonuclease/exonuclease/phosphatase family metal-dependent hydrolase
MLYYSGLKYLAGAAERKRTIDGLKRLRSALSAAIPSRTISDTLLLATWNIREFDSGKYGYRSDEAYYYIAEIISRFDIVAIQEVREGLYPLQKLRKLLGRWWEYTVTDVTLGTSGNSERMAYLYDTRKVANTGLAAEVVLPKAKGDAAEPLQMARSPYVAGFHAGWAYFTLVTAHIYYGEGVPVDERRLKEISALARLIAQNAATLSGAPQYGPDAKPVDSDLLLLGDFNIFNREDATMRAITSAGFVVPDALQTIPGSNVAKDKHYDQIAHLKNLARMKPTGNAGVFDFYEHVYRADDEADYAAEREKKAGRSFKEWRTYRMSDHLPMWIEFGIDDSTAYLDSLGRAALDE